MRKGSSLEENGLFSYEKNVGHLGQKNDDQIRLEGPCRLKHTSSDI